MLYFAVQISGSRRLEPAPLQLPGVKVPDADATFTASGSWLPLSVVDCQCTGEGGNGGFRHTPAGITRRGGGGGGEYAEETALAVTIGNNYSYTIGTGGSSTNTIFPGTRHRHRALREQRLHPDRRGRRHRQLQHHPQRRRQRL